MGDKLRIFGFHGGPLLRQPEHDFIMQGDLDCLGVCLAGLALANLARIGRPEILEAVRHWARWA